MLTLYHRSDTHTVNGLNAYKLEETNSASNGYFGIDIVGTITGYYKSDVKIRHSDGSETIIGSNVAQTSRSSNDEGYQSATWSCPQTQLNSGDALLIKECALLSSYTGERQFITKQLDYLGLASATWTFTRWTTWYNYLFMGNYRTKALIRHGSSSYATRVSGVELQQYVDIGLRIYDGSGTIQVACEPSGTLTSALRIRKGTTTYGIVLVDTTDSNASKIRIKTNSGIKAIAKL